MQPYDKGPSLLSWSLQGTLLFLLTMHCYVNAEQKSGYKTSERPHIILIVADDLGYNDVSFHGSDQIPTPNIDFLAYNGVLLNNYYVSPICTPTRSSIMTGRHPIHTGMQNSTIVGTEPWGVPLEETFLPEYLSQLGYRSSMIGKWHLGMFQWEYTPLYRGFESHFGYYQGCEDYYTHTYEAVLDQWGLDFRRDFDLLWNYTGQYSTTLFRDEAIDVINRHDVSEPLFLYLPFQAVHSSNEDDVNLQAPVEYVDRFSYIENMQRRIYAGMVSALDDAVGDIYDTLKQRDMLNNSIILFTTDNGGPANGFDFNAANNYPLRGLKHTLWEGGVRAVGLLHSPLLKKQGYVSNNLLDVTDWLPTLISAAGGAHLLENMTLDGIDAWKMLSEDGDPIRTELLHNIDPWRPDAALRVGDYKLLVGNIYTEYGDWYPPYQLAGDEDSLHYLKFNKTSSKERFSSSENFRAHLMSKYREYWPQSVSKRMDKLHTSAEKSHLYRKPSRTSASKLMWSSEKPRDDRFAGSLFSSPVTIDCGVKPDNASTNCVPTTAPCLYHIPSDPCEYNNIAGWNTDIVVDMMLRLFEYEADMVPPRNQPFDDAGNPSNHQGAWVPWQ